MIFHCILMKKKLKHTKIKFQRINFVQCNYKFEFIFKRNLFKLWSCLPDWGPDCVRQCVLL